MFLTEKQIATGEKLPAFYYGYSYRDFNRCVTYFHQMPINFIIRLGVWLLFWWNRFRSKPSRMDVQIHGGIHAYLDRFEFNVNRECDRRIKEAVDLYKKANQAL
jgi:hypothetical protein